MAATEDFFPEDEIDEELIKLGYKLISNVDLGNDHRYKKVRSPAGIVVFIDVDRPVKTLVKSDLTMVDSSPLVPPSVIRGAEGNSPDLGTVFECDDGICSISREGHRRNIESYTISSKYTGETIKPPKSVIAYPLVKYSVLIESPVLVLNIIIDTHRESRLTAFTFCGQNLDRYNETLNRLNQVSREFDKIIKAKQKVIWDQQNQILNQIEKINRRNEKIPLDITERASSLNDKALSLLSDCSEISYTQDLLEHISILEQVISSLRKL